MLFRDEEFKLKDALYKGKEGTMYIPMRESSRLDVVKSRALKLADYIELVNDD